MELICVMAIIAILASLLLGSVARAYNSARNKAWRWQVDEFQGSIQFHLLQYYKSQTSYPALTADELFQKNVFDARIMDFLRCPHVHYVPFSSTDPDGKGVFTVDYNWIHELKPTPGNTNEIFLTKKEVTKPK